jgi:hypothetical protein
MEGIMVARNRFTLQEDVNESELSEQRVMPSLLGGVQIPVTRSVRKLLFHNFGY